ncbi:MAG: DUF1385 domain-containing protein [Oscillospiraceae bacterium]|nr:DUF1385 domain-containing protein [Oscillospiraceae bacterium]
MTENHLQEDINTDSTRGPEDSCPKKEENRRTTIGGQALIEGLIMYGPKKAALAVRKADGSIHVEDFHRTLTGGIQDKIPVVRGCVRFFRQIVAGMGALMRSADLSEEGAEPEIKGGSESPVSESVAVEISAPDKELPDIREPASETTDIRVTPASETIDIREPATAVEVAEAESTVEVMTANSSAPAESKPEKKSRFDEFLERHEKGALMVTAGVSVLFSVALFILLPRWLIDIARNFIPSENSDTVGFQLLENLAEGAVRITIFIAYLALTSRMKEIARVWMYHGAEHKTIRCYEAKEPLTVENIRKYSTRHPRCGTAFLFIVILVSIITFSIVGAFLRPLIGETSWWLNSIIRLALVPLVGGISYELLRITGKIDHTAFGRILTKPGMWLQRFTTKEPDDSMLEVAIAAMNAVIPEKEGEDNW